MSSRFHNKFHRHNHHTSSLKNPIYPDAGHDPIAAPESPFLGPFVMYGTLSAIGTAPFAEGADTTTIPDAVNLINAIPGVFIASNPTDVAIQAIGSIQTTGNLSADNISFTGNVISAYAEPLIANGDFLQVNINGTIRYIRLWNFY